MDRNLIYSGNTVNQLQALSEAGYFTTPASDIPSVTPLAEATNSAFSLEYRSRSYLSANCAQCHQPGGGGLGYWDGRFTTPMTQAGITNGALVNNLGDTNNFVVALGSLSNSVLLTRVANMGPQHMPPLATSVLNTRAVQLLSAWITNPASITSQLGVSPSSLNFGAVTVGSNTTASFVLSSIGGGTITNGAASISGGPFTILSGASFDAPGSGTTNVLVRFAPGSPAAFTNNIIFTTANGGTSTNQLIGTGLSPAQLAVSPGSIAYGLLAVGSNVQAAFTVTNQGGTSLTSGAAAVDGGPFIVVSGSPFSLPGFGTTNVVVTFAPTNASTFSNIVVFTTSNGGNATNAVTGSSAIPPVADFTALPTAGDWPLSVSFTDLSTGTITNSLWDFGDGAATNTAPGALTHNYLLMGTNTVSLTVSGPLGTNTLVRPNYIVITNVPPVTLSILLVSNQVQLIWREGTLQSAGDTADPYINMPAATSPYVLPPSDATRYFRVKVR